MARRLPDNRVKKLFAEDARLNPLRAVGSPPSPMGGKVAGGQYYGLVLREKQKMRAYYGNMKDRQFKKYVEDARRHRGNPVEYLMGRLETRLETVLFRTGFPVSFRQAQQWICHGHVLLNGYLIDKKSAAIRPGDMIQIAPSFLEVASRQAVVAAEMRKESGNGAAWGRSGSAVAMLGYLEINRLAMCATLVRDPVGPELEALTHAPLYPLVKDSNLQPRTAMIYYR